MFEFAEEALDEVALAVQAWIDRPLDLPVALGCNVSLTAPLTDQIDQVFPVIAAIRNDDGGNRKGLQQVGGGGLVGSLSGRESEANRQPVLVDDDMDLAGQSSTRTTDGVIRTSFLPPAACWWARTMEESISGIDCGEAAARASNTRSQTPAFAHRL